MSDVEMFNVRITGERRGEPGFREDVLAPKGVARTAEVAAQLVRDQKSVNVLGVKDEGSFWAVEISTPDGCMMGLQIQSDQGREMLNNSTITDLYASRDSNGVRDSLKHL